MLSISKTGSVALFLFQKAARSPVWHDGAGSARATDLVSIASGVSPSGSQSVQAKDRIVSSLFDRSTPDINELKVRLMERLGDELGVDMADFDSVRSYGLAIRQTVDEIRQDPDGGQFLAEIERKLGLDDLGISLDMLIHAMTDETGEAGRKLDAALKAHLGDLFSEQDKAAPATLAPDDIGIYGF